ncbi:MAG: MG2 domain-containing protein [Armatimonadota bacterium]
MKTCPSPLELEQFVLDVFEMTPDRRLRIQEHLAECPDCRRALAQSEEALRSLREPVAQEDPGDAFTAAIMQKTRRSLGDQLWKPGWPPFGRVFAWAATAAVLLFILYMWTFTSGVGRDRVIVAVPPRVIADAPLALPVYVTDPSGKPIPGSTVQITGRALPTLTGRTDGQGFYQASLHVPAAGKPALHLLRVNVQTPSGEHEVTVPLQTEQAETLYLSTDKPLYQPGQTIHLRLLCLQRVGTRPVAGRKAVLTIRDGRDNLLIKQSATTSDWGIAHVEFPLDAEAGLGDYTIEANCGENTATRTVTVSRYNLPKFKATLTTGKGWFLPGQTITGSLDARYFFGKPCVGATVSIAGVAGAGINVRPFAMAKGNTSAEGKFAFRLPLPARLYGSPATGGNAVVTVKATVTDAGGHVQEISRDYPVSKEAILVSVLPESGAPVVGVENEFYIVTSYPDGTPARTTVRVLAPVETTVTTDAQGVGAFRYTPPSGAVSVSVQAIDASGLTGSLSRALTSVGERLHANDDVMDMETGEPLYQAPTILIRTDRPAYRTGDTAQISILAPEQQGLLYLEITRDKQPVCTRVIPLANGRAKLALPITNDIAGLLSLHAYLPGALMSGENEDAGYYRSEFSTLVAQGSRTLFVQPADELKIALDGLHEKRPGETQQVTLRVTDPKGKGVAAAVGLSGVDEAVYAIEDQHPGLARQFFLMQRQLDDPTFEAHTADLPGRFHLDNAMSQQVSAGKVAMAAYDAQPMLLVSKYGEREQSRLEYRREKRLTSLTVFTIGGLLLFLILLTTLKTMQLRTVQATIAEDGSSIAARNAGLVVTTFIGMCFIIGLLASDIAVLGICLALFWWLLVLAGRYQILKFGGCSLVEVAVGIGIIAILGTILFPVFAKAREKSRQSSMRSALRMAETSREAAKEGMRGRESASPSAAVRLREYFPETLTWQPEIITDEKGTAQVTLPAADSITDWRLSLLANTRDGRMGSAEIPYRVFQPFFVDIDAPVQLTVGDAFSLPVAVHNYAKSAQTIALTLDARDGLTPAGSNTASLTLAPGAVGKAYFPLDATAAGRAEITVKAIGGTVSDATRRHVDVVPQGTRTEVSSNAVLREKATLRINLPRQADLQDSDLTLRLYPGPLSQVLAGLDGLLQQPHGCFEQTTSTTYPNLMVLRYLRESNSKDVAAMAKAQTYVMLGYQRLLGFEVEGGGFSLYGNEPAEFGLTALGLLEFQDMSKVQAVDAGLLKRTAEWLSTHWKSASPPERSMAAWALARSGNLTQTANWIIERSAQESQISTYELTLLANAAVAAEHPNAGMLLKTLASRAQEKQEGTCWTRTQVDRRGYETWMGWDDAEITGLAVQALAGGDGYTTLTRKGIDFLVACRQSNGGWPGTQATVQALHALMAVNTLGANGTVKIVANGKSVQSVTLNGDGVVTAVKLKDYLRAGKNTVEIRADKGVSPAAQLVARYYAPWKSLPASKNPISVSYDKSQLQAGDVATASVSVNMPRKVEMAMVDLAIPPGFLPLMEDLEAMKSAKKIERYEVTGTQIILYLRSLPAGNTAFHYRLRALFPIKATVRPSTVYPYYEPTKIYRSAPGTMSVL